MLFVPIIHSQGKLSGRIADLYSISGYLELTLCSLSRNLDMVDVEVGDNPADTWRLHKYLLTTSSDYFRAVVNSPFQEGVENKVILGEEDNAVFALFVQWLYSRTFTATDMDILLRTYVLGDRLAAPDFAALALDKIYMDAPWYSFSPYQIIWVTENTTSNSALRRLVIESTAFKILNGTLSSFTAEDWDALAPVHCDILQVVTNSSHTNARVNALPNPVQLPPRSTYTDAN